MLHLGLAAQFGYDSNIFFQNSGTTGAFLLSILPSFDLATRSTGGPHKIDFRLHGSMDYNEFLTGDSSLSQHRTFGVQAGGLLTIMPGYAVSLDILDNYVRTSQPPYAANGGAPSNNIDRDTNEAGFRLRVRPGGGRLELLAAYSFGIDLFEEQAYKDLDVFYHRANLRLQWKFFPKTAIYIDANEIAYQYPHPGSTLHPDSYPLRITLGLQGLITPKLTLHLFVGYANGFYQPVTDPTTGMKVQGPSPNTGVGGMELKWKPFYSSTGTLGYRHDFENSLIGSYYDLDSAFISWLQGIWRFVGFVELRYSNIRYQGISGTSGVVPPSRTDNLINFTLRFEYPFKDWLTLMLGYTLTYNNASSKIDLGPAGLVPVDYLKHYVWLRLAVLY